MKSPSRRLWIGPILCLAAALLLMFAPACHRGLKPSMILVIIDTFPAGHSSAYGYRRSTTPALEGLAADGIRYEHAVAAAPWTLPSIASLLTGTLPQRHLAGWRQDKKNVDQHHLAKLNPEITTMAELFKEQGYETVGFFNNHFLHRQYGLDKGFDTYDFQGGDNLKIRAAPETFDDAINWTDVHGDKPFFMVIHLFDLHLAYNPPPEYAQPFTKDYEGPLTNPFNPDLDEMRAGKMTLTHADKEFVKGLFDAEIAATDVELGRFMNYLKKKGLYDQTMIVVTADHGEEFWEHGGFEHGHSLHRELLEVPLVIKYPKKKFKGSVVKQYVSLTDVLPTLAEYYNLPAPLDLDGVSLLPRGGSVKAPPHLIVSMNLYYGPEQQSYYDQGIKLILNVETGKISIYDLTKDPFENHDVFGEIQPPKSIKHQIQKIARELDRLREHPEKAETVNLDQETVRQLESLGYFSKSPSSANGATASPADGKTAPSSGATVDGP